MADVAQAPPAQEPKAEKAKKDKKKGGQDGGLVEVRIGLSSMLADGRALTLVRDEYIY